MVSREIDFLQIDGADFDSLKGLTRHISENVDLSELQGDLSVLSGISNYKSRTKIKSSLGSHFEIYQDNGNTIVMNAKKRDVPYVVFLSDEGEHGLFPVFFTTGRKTKDIPETLDRYLKHELDVGRLWISKTEMENLRNRIIDTYPEVLMPYFAASRSRHTDVPARYRPRYERTIQYNGDDGLETFEQMKYDYGVLPTNLKFQKANEFKFRVNSRGIFTIKNAGMREVLSVIQDSITRLHDVKEAIDTSNFTEENNQYSHENSILLSRPWAISLTKKLESSDIRQFKQEELEKEWEFELGAIKEPSGNDDDRFEVELIDARVPGSTVLRSHKSSLRVYPRERTGIDQSIRVFEFVNDQIDPDAVATIVA